MKGWLDEPSRAALSALVTAHFGLRFPPDRWDDLEHGVATAARLAGAVDAATWAAGLLKTEPTYAQLQALATALTVGETYFYRQGDVFRYIAERLLPELRQRDGGTNRRLRIWSAACSTGEEAYSIAMMLLDHLPNLPEWDVRVLATDVNPRALKVAGKGTYSNWSFRDTPPGLKEKHFIRLANGQYQVNAKVRDRVRFAIHNLIRDPFPAEAGGFDLIFCRNVLMYFSSPWQEHVLSGLWRALSPQGHLVIGPCDTHPVLQERFRSREASPTILRRRLGVEEKLPTPAFFAEPASVPVADLGTVTDAPPLLGPSASTPAADGVAAPRADAARLAEVTRPAEASTDEILSAANRRNFSEALRLCAMAVESDKLNPGLRYLRACILNEAGREAEAAADFRRVLFLDPGYVAAHLALAHHAHGQGDDPAAQRHLRQASDVLRNYNRGDIVPGTEGLTAARLQAVVNEELGRLHAA